MDKRETPDPQLLQLPEPSPRLEEPSNRPAKDNVNAIARGLEVEVEMDMRQSMSNKLITFTRADAKIVQYPHRDLMVDPQH